MLLIDFAREEVGLPMDGMMFNRHIGWTTDGDKAETMRKAGANVQWHPSLDKRDEARKFDGWDISFLVGSERLEVIAA